MKNIIIPIALILLAALFIITFIVVPADIPVHITLGLAILVAVFGVVIMKKRHSL